MLVSIALITTLSAGSQGASLENSMPVRVVRPWSVAVGPGSLVRDGVTVTVPKEVVLEVAGPEVVHVKDERHERVPVLDRTAGKWRQGERFAQLAAEECPATGLLVGESVRIKGAAGADAPAFALGKDYEMDAFWASFGRIESGAIKPDQAVFADYDYEPSRLDSIVVDPSGAVTLVKGEAAVAVVLPAAPAAIANIWVPGRTRALTDAHLYPIEFRPTDALHPRPPQTGPSVAETLLPKTLAKLRGGQPVTIVAWGDSVTAGGGIGNLTDKSYQARFLALLQERFPQSTDFPKSAITMLTAAWPGGSSEGYMTAPKGGEYDFVRDVLDPRPDLVTVEFVNDAGLTEEATQTHYAKILEQLKGVGAEVVLLTPHLVRPDWMGAYGGPAQKTDADGTVPKFDDDPRPYVKGLRRFAAENQVALGDASQEWCRLWRQGIPYVTLLANGINHPDARGHEIFAQTLIRLFPEK